MFGGQAERSPVAARQQVGFPLTTALPDRPNCVDDVMCGQVESGGDFCISRGASTQPPTSRQELWSRSAMNGTIHAAAGTANAVGNRPGL